MPSDAGVADAGPDDAGPYDAGIGSATPVDGGTCTLTTDTYATSVTNAAGCNVLVRDAAGCVNARTALGLGSFWLRFSCRVTLSREGSGAGAVVVASSDNQPDYKSNYFTDAHACREIYTSAIMNPNRIATKSLSVRFPVAPNTSAGMMTSAVVGLAVNGVAIFGNFAAPGDDIFQEAKTFDRCGAHPQGSGTYHYHSEPYAITYDDGNFVGVLRDGYPVYGRREPDGSMPAGLDAYGGHTGLTIDSPDTPVYHYHVNAQTSTTHGTHGDTQWFLTTGSYRGAPATCTSCN